MRPIMVLNSWLVATELKLLHILQIIKIISNSKLNVGQDDVAIVRLG